MQHQRHARSEGAMRRAMAHAEVLVGGEPRIDPVARCMTSEEASGVGREEDSAGGRKREEGGAEAQGKGGGEEAGGGYGGGRCRRGKIGTALRVGNADGGGEGVMGRGPDGDGGSGDGTPRLGKAKLKRLKKAKRMVGGSAPSIPVIRTVQTPPARVSLVLPPYLKGRRLRVIFLLLFLDLLFLHLLVLRLLCTALPFLSLSLPSSHRKRHLLA